MTTAQYKSSLHLLAVLTAVATFPLIFMGGLVTSHGAGMSVPDWPNSYGYNMFLFPPRLWIGGILYEHTHRLMGTVVGMLSILLVIWAWRLESRRWVRWTAAAVLGAVIFQGVLGGLRVVWVKLDLAIVHACFAQAFFCLTAFMAAATSRWWHERFSSLGTLNTSLPCPCTDRTVQLSVLTFILIYGQLVIGAVMRHYQAGLAIPDLPLAYGHWLPPTTSQELAEINRWRAWQPGLEQVTMGQVWLHFAHRAGAVLVSLAILSLAVCIWRRHRAERLANRPALLLVALLIAQLTLGVLTVLMKKPADVASLHVAMGALTLFTTFTLLVRSICMTRWPPAAAFEIVRLTIPSPVPVVSSGAVAV